MWQKVGISFLFSEKDKEVEFGLKEKKPVIFLILWLRCSVTRFKHSLVVV